MFSKPQSEFFSVTTAVPSGRASSAFTRIHFRLNKRKMLIKGKINHQRKNLVYNYLERLLSVLVMKMVSIAP